MSTHKSHIMNSALMLLLFFLLLLSQDVLTSNVNWSQLTAEQLSALPSDTIARASSADIRSIPAASCVGFTQLQINSTKDEYPLTTCSGFTMDCLKNIKDDVYQGFQPNCLKHFTTKAASAIAASQMNNIPPSSFSGLIASVVRGFSDGCAGITADQLSYLKEEYPVDACSGFSKQCLSLIPDNSFAGFQPRCLGHLTESSLANVTADQIRNLSPSSAPGITKTQLAGLGLTDSPQCSGFTKEFLEQLPNVFPSDSCAGFNGKCLGSISAATSFGFQQNCIRKFTEKAIAGITAKQLAGFDPNQFGGFTPKSLRAITVEACAGFTAAQLSNLDNSYPNNACSGFTADCISKISPSAISGWTSSCTRSLDEGALTKISIDQVASIPVEAMVGFKRTHLIKINPNVCSGFKSSQISNLDTTYPVQACQGVSAECLSKMVGDTFDGITTACASQFLDNALSLLSATQVSKLPLYSIRGLKKNHLSNMNPQVCGGFSSEQLENLDTTYPSNVCAGLIPGCITNITLSSVQGFQRKCVSQMTIQATNGILVEQLPYFTRDAVGGFKGEHFVALTRRLSLDFVNTLTYDQVSDVDGAVISHFKSSIRTSELTKRLIQSSELSTMHWLQLAYSVEKSILKVLTAQSITNLTELTFAGLRGDVLANLPENILAQISPAQIYNLLDDAVANITAKQISEISPNSFLRASGEGIMHNFRFISVDAIPNITLDQLTNALTKPSRLELQCTCPQFNAMTSEQIDLIADQRDDIYQTMRRRCAVPPPKPHHSKSSTLTQWNSISVVLMMILASIVHHALFW